MTTSRSTARIAAPLLLAGLIGLAACSKPASSTITSPTPASVPVSADATPVLGATAAATATAPASGSPPPANGYSCSFPGPGGRAILARFTLDGAGAHDDQGLPFTVLTNSPTALVMAHARDDVAAAPNGDIGAYVVAIDRRSLGMVQTTIGLNGPGSTRHGHCIAG